VSNRNDQKGSSPIKRGPKTMCWLNGEV